jgi:hypothetical protein
VSQGDSWEQRYLSVVPEKLTAAEAQVLLDLIRENPEGFLGALQAFIKNSRDDLGEEVAEDA